MSGLAFLLLMLKHSVHHRGQLSSGLARHGWKIPDIYGPSANSQMTV